jgi:hypothetical protein
MVAIRHSDFQTPRAQGRLLYRDQQVRHRHDGRGEFWKLALLCLAAFWTAIGYGIYVLT